MIGAITPFPLDDLAGERQADAPMPGQGLRSRWSTARSSASKLRSSRAVRKATTPGATMICRSAKSFTSSASTRLSSGGSMRTAGRAESREARSGSPRPQRAGGSRETIRRCPPFSASALKRWSNGRSGTGGASSRTQAR
jgi:hypothetical protein